MNSTVTSTCKHCGGKGYWIRARQIGRGQFVREDETCTYCDGAGTIGTDPEPTPPAPAGRLEVGGYTVDAPTFRSAAQFDAAVGRAFADGLTVSATSRADVVIVKNHATGATYRTSRTTCECEAGQHGLPCKHQAAMVMYADVFHEVPASRAA